MAAMRERVRAARVSVREHVADRCPRGNAPTFGRIGWRVVAPGGRAVAVSKTAFHGHEASRAAFGGCHDHALPGGGLQHGPEINGWIRVVHDEGA
jgi:hypothetical protein